MPCKWIEKIQDWLDGYKAALKHLIVTDFSGFMWFVLMLAVAITVLTIGSCKRLWGDELVIPEAIATAPAEYTVTTTVTVDTATAAAVLRADEIAAQAREEFKRHQEPVAKSNTIWARLTLTGVGLFIGYLGVADWQENTAPSIICGTPFVLTGCTIVYLSWKL